MGLITDLTSADIDRLVALARGLPTSQTATDLASFGATQANKARLGQVLAQKSEELAALQTKLQANILAEQNVRSAAIDALSTAQQPAINVKTAEVEAARAAFEAL